MSEPAMIDQLREAFPQVDWKLRYVDEKPVCDGPLDVVFHVAVFYNINRIDGSRRYFAQLRSPSGQFKFTSKSAVDPVVAVVKLSLDIFEHQKGFEAFKRIFNEE